MSSNYLRCRSARQLAEAADEGVVVRHYEAGNGLREDYRIRVSQSKCKKVRNRALLTSLRIWESWVGWLEAGCLGWIRQLRAAIAAEGAPRHCQPRSPANRLQLTTAALHNPARHHDARECLRFPPCLLLLSRKHSPLLSAIVLSVVCFPVICFGHRSPPLDERPFSPGTIAPRLPTLSAPHPCSA